MTPAVDALLLHAEENVVPPILRRKGYWTALNRGDFQKAQAIEAEALFEAGLALGLELGRL